LGWLGWGPPLGRMGLGRMARPILRLAPVRRSLPGSLLRRRLHGSDRRLCADQRIFRPAAARCGLPRQGIYARWRRGVRRPLHPGRRSRNRRAAARRPTPGRPVAQTLKRRIRGLLRKPHHGHRCSPGGGRSLSPGLFQSHRAPLSRCAGGRISLAEPQPSSTMPATMMARI